MHVLKSIRVLKIFIAFVVVINLISAPKFVQAEWAPKKPAYQLVDAKGVLIGVVVADEKTGPVIYDNRVTVYAGGDALEWNLVDDGDDINIVYKGVDCVEPWFFLNQPYFNYRWMNSMWIKSGDEFKIPSDMSTRSGDFSQFADKKCIGPSTSRGANIFTSDKAWTIKKIATNVWPNRTSLTWPLRVVPDKEVNGPLFFNSSYGITGVSDAKLKTTKQVGSFYFSASEPYLYFDIVAKNSKEKVVKRWRNQRTGLWGTGSVRMDNETIQSITKYNFSLIYKGKVVATLP